MAAEIVINARAAARPELGGVERWARELRDRLPRLRPGRYAVAEPPEALSHRAGHAWEQGLLPLKAHGAKALLNPANLAPIAYGRNVIVIHDAAALRNPAWYSGVYAAWQARVLPAVARRALHVVTVSEFSRGEIVDLLEVPPHKVSVIPGGVDARFHPRATTTPRERPYVLCVASATARKNLAALRPAAEALARDGVELVVAGGGRPQFAAEQGLDALTLLGHVDDADLPGLYAQAQAFVLPSLHEGFGLTAIEAMASGTPVVATTAGALPDTTGGAAHLVEPDPEALRDGLTTVLSDELERRRLRAAGLERAKHFSWDRTVRELDTLLSAAAP